MPKGIFRSHKVHGLAFDGAAFLGNLALISFLPRIGDEVPATTASAFLLLAVLAQMGGAWWKKSFLAQRLAHRAFPPRQGLARGFMNLLLFFHFLLFTVMTLFAFALIGIYDIDGSSSFFTGDVWVLIALFVGGFTTYLVRRAEQSGGLAERPGTRPGWLEFGADGLLWVSVSIATRLFWDGLVMLIQPSSGIGVSGEGVLLLVAMSLLYVFFYLPSRYLFLVEDYQSALTWVQVGVAMLPVVWLVVIG
jgi:hypothetical protein